MVRSIDQFEVNVEGAVGLCGPAIAGGKRDPMFGCRSGDEGIVNGAAGQAERCQPGMEPLRTLGAEEPRTGEVVCEQPGHGGGVRRLGGGSRVSTEKVSKAA
jgi:hypothetical protein